MATPEATVTMIGATGCGKTTYMLGMYSVMSAGLSGYYLAAQNLDLDYDLAERWEDMRTYNNFPRPNLIQEPVPYPFFFRDNNQTLVKFAWEDYRGGAMDDRAHEADSVQLDARLLKSDSIYLTLDGTEFLTGVNDQNIADVRHRTRATRMGPRLSHVFDECDRRDRGYPSLIILVTKSDKIADANPGATQRELLDLVYESASRLVPACFDENRNTMVCPVQVCRDEIDPVAGQPVRRVSARNVHYPLLYSFLHYLNAHADGLRDSLGSFEQTLAENEERLRALKGQFWAPILRSKEIDQRRLRAEEDEKTRDERRRTLDVTQGKVAKLAAMIEDAIVNDNIAVFENGARL